MLAGNYTSLVAKYRHLASKKREVIYERQSNLLAADPLLQKMGQQIFGGMPVEYGYCTGINPRLNGLEYHRSSEVNVALTDLVLLLGKRWDIQNGYYDTNQLRAFLVPRGKAVELYDTTLHYAPLSQDSPFLSIVLLLKGTNLPIVKHHQDSLSSQNQWFLAHLQAATSADYVGLRGPNPGITEVKK